MITIPCKVSKGMFSDEWLIEVKFPRRRKETFSVYKSKVYMGKEPSDHTKTVDGEVEVVIVEEKGKMVLVDLPSPGTTSGPRFKVPKGFLKPAVERGESKR